MAIEQGQGLPIIVGWPCKEKCFKVIDCESGRVSNVGTKGQLEFSCGVGPKASANRDGSIMVVGNQSEDREITFYRVNK